MGHQRDTLGPATFFFRTAYCLADCSKALCCCFFFISFVIQLFYCISLDTAVTDPSYSHLDSDSESEMMLRLLDILKRDQSGGTLTKLHCFANFVAHVAAVVIRLCSPLAKHVQQHFCVFLHDSSQIPDPIADGWALKEKKERKRKGKEKKTPQARSKGKKHSISITISPSLSPPLFLDGLDFYTPIHMTLTTMSIPLPSPPSYL
jgi:hypothetical protein